MKTATWLLATAVLILVFFFLIHTVWAADIFAHDRPEGFAGVGHAENHDHYQGLNNPLHHSCCNDTDCRPTVARFDGARWWVKVNGIWRDDFSTSEVLNDEWLRSEQRRLGQPVTGRWNTEAHVCASRLTNAISIQPATIYCVILSDEWN